MTIKNFLKTAVLGIAFCSAFGMSNSIAQSNPVVNQINEIRSSINKSIISVLNNKLAYFHKDYVQNILNETEIFPVVRSILEIMANAEHNLISQKEYDLLVNKCDELKNTSNINPLNIHSIHGDYFYNVKKYIMAHENEIKDLLQQRIMN